MKKITLLLIISFSQLTIFSQPFSEKVDFKLGVIHKKTSKNSFWGIEFIASDSTSFYVLQVPYSSRAKKNPYYIAKHNYDMSQYNYTELSLKEQKVDKNYEFIFQFKNNIFLFTSFQNRKQKKHFLFVQTINKQNLNVNNDLKKIAEIDYSMHDKYKLGKFDYQISPDSSKILIQYYLLNKDSEILSYGFNVFNNDFENLWNYNGNFPIADKEFFKFMQFQIDNKGTVYLLGKIYSSEKDFNNIEKRKSFNLITGVKTIEINPNYTFKIVKFKKDMNLQEYYCDFQNKFLTNMKIAVTDNQNLLCAGMYSNPNTMSVIGSYCFKIMENSNKIDFNNFQKFDIELVKIGMKEKDSQNIEYKIAEGINFEQYRYFLEDIKFSNDGGFWLIGEQFLHHVKRKQMGNQIYYENHKQNDNIYVIKYNPEGSISWSKKILKEQYVVDAELYNAGFAWTKSNDKLYFLFNQIESPDFFSLTGMALQNSKFISVILDKKGNESRNDIFTTKEVGVALRIFGEYLINVNSEIILYGQNKKKKFRYVKFNLKKDTVH